MGAEGTEKHQDPFVGDPQTKGGRISEYFYNQMDMGAFLRRIQKLPHLEVGQEEEVDVEFSSVGSGPFADCSVIYAHASSSRGYACAHWEGKPSVPKCDFTTGMTSILHLFAAILRRRHMTSLCCINSSQRSYCIFCRNITSYAVILQRRQMTSFYRHLNI